MADVKRESSWFVTYLPEVLYHRITFSVAAVIGVLLPVVDINICDTANEQLELALVEDVDQVLRDELAEARHERVKLLLDTLRDTVLHDRVHVVLLVLLRDGDVSTARLELDRNHLAETLLDGRERLIDDVGDVVLTVTR